MELKRYKFIKEDTGKWYVDLPEWEGEKWELEMVCGADTMLDLISQGEDNAYLTLSLEHFKLEDESDCFELSKIKDTPDIGGALNFYKPFLL